MSHLATYGGPIGDIVVILFGLLCLVLLGYFCFARGGKDYESEWRK